ncbi:MAG TPA: four helix bundle protein [Thermoanaerobaculia bacterium]|nr:four helix bundle protein [Thermoanaerobaculia bacterium]
MSLETNQAWQLAMAVVPMIYKLTASFPREERYVLTSQIRRAAVSIPSNIAEGYARPSRRDYARFICHAQGSTAELSTQLKIASNLGYMTMNERLADDLDHLARSLNNLRRSLLRSARIPNPESRTPKQ